MTTTEQTHDDVAPQADPNTLLGVALGFAGVILIAKEKMLLGALSLAGGALIGLRSHREQQEGAETSSPQKEPTAPKQLATKPAALKRAASKPASAKVTTKKAKAAKPQAVQASQKAAAPKTAVSKKAAAKKATPKKATPKKAAVAKPTVEQAEAQKTPARKSSAASSPAKGELNQLEGIGPKIAEVLGAAGIETFAQMAQATPERLRETLAAAGNRFRLADPSTWPDQAALAAAGKWDDLNKLKGQLKGGRRRG